MPFTWRMPFRRASGVSWLSVIRICAILAAALAFHQIGQGRKTGGERDGVGSASIFVSFDQYRAASRSMLRQRTARRTAPAENRLCSGPVASNHPFPEEEPLPRTGFFQAQNCPTSAMEMLGSLSAPGAPHAIGAGARTNAFRSVPSPHRVFRPCSRCSPQEWQQVCVSRPFGPDVSRRPVGVACLPARSCRCFPPESRLAT